MWENRWAAGAPPQIPLRELTALPQIPSWWGTDWLPHPQKPRPRFRPFGLTENPAYAISLVRFFSCQRVYDCVIVRLALTHGYLPAATAATVACVCVWPPVIVSTWCQRRSQRPAHPRRVVHPPPVPPHPLKLLPLSLARMHGYWHRSPVRGAPGNETYGCFPWSLQWDNMVIRPRANAAVVMRSVASVCLSVRFSWLCSYFRKLWPRNFSTCFGMRGYAHMHNKNEVSDSNSEYEGQSAILEVPRM